MPDYSFPVDFTEYESLPGYTEERERQEKERGRAEEISHPTTSTASSNKTIREDASSANSNTDDLFQQVAEKGKEHIVSVKKGGRLSAKKSIARMPETEPELPKSKPKWEHSRHW